MIDLDQASRLIAGHEGFRSYVYDDAAPNRPYTGGAVRGTLTIGYGETRPDLIERYRGGIAEPEAFDLLRQRVAGFAAEIAKGISADLNVNQWAAVTSLAYNIGAGAFGSSTALKRINANPSDFAGIREAWSWWNKAGGKVLEGLSRRRREESDLYETPVAGAPSGGDDRTYGWREIDRFVAGSPVRSARPTIGQSYGGKHSPTSWHYRDSMYAGPNDGCAVDYGDANSDPQAIYDLLVPFAGPGGPIVELIWQHTIWRRGVKSYYAPNDHMDHLHAAIYPDRQLPALTQPAPIDQEDPMAAAYLVCRRDGRWYLTNLIDKPRYIESVGVLQMLARNGVPLLNKDPVPGKPAGTIEDDVWRQINGDS